MIALLLVPEHGGALEQQGAPELIGACELEGVPEPGGAPEASGVSEQGRAPEVGRVSEEQGEPEPGGAPELAGAQQPGGTSLAQELQQHIQHLLALAAPATPRPLSLLLTQQRSLDSSQAFPLPEAALPPVCH